MTRRRPRLWDDEVRDPRIHREVTVYAPDPAEVWHDTGLLGPDGEPILRYAGPQPIGFLWDVERDVSRETTLKLSDLPEDAYEPESRETSDTTVKLEDKPCAQCRIADLPQDATEVGC